MENETRAQKIRGAAERLAKLGNWPAWLDAQASLASRLPAGNKTAPGFDAGIACALDLIPDGKQSLAAKLHAAYTEKAVDQIRRETKGLDADSETAWWLAACSICREGTIDEPAFVAQIEAFRELAADPSKRIEAAKSELARMRRKYRILPDGIPFATEDGGIQGAYVGGYDWGVQYSAAYGIWFVSTFRPSLGLEDFTFSTHVDATGRPMSGPVHGSRQFVKACTLEELGHMVKTVRDRLGLPRPL